MRLIYKQNVLYSLRKRSNLNKKARKKMYKELRRKKALKKYVPFYTHELEAPRLFSIREEIYRGAVLDFLSQIKAASKIPNARIRLDFRPTERMYVAASLLFCATLSSANANKARGVVFRCSTPKVRKISELLTHLRILKECNQNFQIEPEFNDVVGWHYAHGVEAVGEDFEPFLSKYDGTISELLSEGLFVGLTEAVINTKHHAHPKREEGSSQGSDWWMFSREEDGMLTVAICDIGVGIPATIEKKHPYIIDILGKIFPGVMPTDGQIIKATIDHKRTSTGQSNRGKGLTQLNSVIDLVEGDAHFQIYSSKGRYFKTREKAQYLDYDTDIGGTLISWRIPLPSSEG